MRKKISTSTKIAFQWQFCCLSTLPHYLYKYIWFIVPSEVLSNRRLAPFSAVFSYMDSFSSCWKWKVYYMLRFWGFPGHSNRLMTARWSSSSVPESQWGSFTTPTCGTLIYHGAVPHRHLHTHMHTHQRLTLIVEMSLFSVISLSSRLIYMQRFSMSLYCCDWKAKLWSCKVSVGIFINLYHLTVR